jgi:uncharacterized protein
MSNSHEGTITAARQFVQQQMPEDHTGHDYLHVERVWKMSKMIARECGANSTVVELAALFHDISDYKLNGGDEAIGPEIARQWIRTHTMSSDMADTVAQIILDILYRGANSGNDLKLSIEAQCVQDADRLDAMGAIGIARAFAFGGALNQPMMSADIQPVLHRSFEEYKLRNGTTINHFYEKLLLLKDRMNTPFARKIAEQRHAFMARFPRKLKQRNKPRFWISESSGLAIFLPARHTVIRHAGGPVTVGRHYQGGPVQTQLGKTAPAH